MWIFFEYHPAPDKNHATGVKIGGTGHKNKIRKVASTYLPWCILKVLQIRIANQPTATGKVLPLEKQKMIISSNQRKKWKKDDWYTNNPLVKRCIYQ